MSFRPDTNYNGAIVGAVFVYLGNANGLGNVPAWTVHGTQQPALFGMSVSSADVNGDGFSDVIVGEPSFNNATTGGRALVYLGSPNGLTMSPAWTADANQPLAQFGESVSSAGDVNGDGYEDVIIGSRGSGAITSAGRVFVYMGSPNGLAATPAWISADASNQRDVRCGASVSGAGDVNGDGFDDVIIGAPFLDNGQTDAGAVFLHFLPKETIPFRGWTRGGPGGGTDLGLKGPNLTLVNLLPSPVGNIAVSLSNGPAATRVTVSYANALSGYTTNAPWPISPAAATQWVTDNCYTAEQMAAIAVPINPATGQTNSGWQLEHVHQSCSGGLMVLTDSGLFGFCHRFRSLTGFSNLRRRGSLVKNQKTSPPSATSVPSML